MADDYNNHSKVSFIMLNKFKVIGIKIHVKIK